MNLFWSITLFWAVAAAGMVLALAFVLPFLLRNRSAEHIQAARRDINLAVYRDQMQELKAELSSTQLSQEQFLASKLELETRAAEDALSQEERAAMPVASSGHRPLSLARQSRRTDRRGQRTQRRRHQCCADRGGHLADDPAD